MYSIEKKPFGFKLTFSGVISDEEMKNWTKDTQQALVGILGFAIFADMRSLNPISPKAQHILAVGQQLYKKAGIERSVVILTSMTLALQFKRLAQESGMYQWERYIDASSNENWQRSAEAWIIYGKDPDKV